MNRKEPIKTVMVISIWKKTFGLQGFRKKNSALQGLSAKHDYSRL